MPVKGLALYHESNKQPPTGLKSDRTLDGKLVCQLTMRMVLCMAVRLGNKADSALVKSGISWRDWQGKRTNEWSQTVDTATKRRNGEGWEWEGTICRRPGVGGSLLKGAQAWQDPQARRSQSGEQGKHGVPGREDGHAQRRPGSWKEIRKRTEWPGPSERGGLAQNMAEDQWGPTHWAVIKSVEFLLDTIGSQWSPLLRRRTVRFVFIRIPLPSGYRVRKSKRGGERRCCNGLSHEADVAATEATEVEVESRSGPCCILEAELTALKSVSYRSGELGEWLIGLIKWLFNYTETITV